MIRELFNYDRLNLLDSKNKPKRTKQNRPLNKGQGIF